jgi:hypothetical protein
LQNTLRAIIASRELPQFVTGEFCNWLEVDITVADQVGSLLANVMIEAFRDVLPNGPTRFLAVPGVGPTWAAAKADGEMREKALRARCVRLSA